MATVTYYFQNADPSFTPPAVQGTWDTSTSVTYTGMGAKSGVANSGVIAIGSTDANYDLMVHRFISPALAADTAFTGTIDGVIGAVENNAAENAYLHLHVFVWDPTGEAVRGTLLNNYIDADEMSTSSTTGGEGFSATGGDVNAVAGDRIIVEAGGRASSSDAAYTIRIRFGSTDGVDLTNDGDSATYPGWIRFSYTSSDTFNPRAMRTQFIPPFTGGR